MSLQILYYVLLIWCIVGANSDDPEVEIPQGILSGDTRINRDGGIYYSFRNIPFAKPPVGELRFKAPEPADGWEGKRDATEEMPQCFQAMQGQEDCLYLNVFTPALPAENESLKPVMVYLFGGGFVMGNALESNYGAQFLLTKDVVLVVPNYRLGILGFLSLDDPDLGVTGNAGMKDQVQALKWVQENIAYFGGDPNNVLLFGESAGGISVHLNILSPMSQGLFKKAISHSGVSLVKDLITPPIRNTGQLVAEALGIQTDNWEEMLISLQNESVESITSAANSFSEYRFFTVPLPEMKGSNHPTFLDADPIDIIRSGDYNHVPYIVGFNNAEGLMYEISAIEETGESWVITDFSQYIPGDLNVESGSEEEENLSERIKRFYYGDTEPTKEDVRQAISLATDYDFAYPTYRAVVEHLKTALFPTYFYIFSADTELNYSKMDNDVSFPGASHGDDLGYIFFASVTPDITEGSVEDLAIKRMVNLWTNFAIYDDPTPEGFDEFQWEPVQADQFYYAHIDTVDTNLYVNPKANNFAFWSEVYEEYFEN